MENKENSVSVCSSEHKESQLKKDLEEGVAGIKLEGQAEETKVQNQEEREGGKYDKDGFFIFDDGSFEDLEGTHFNKEGYDEEGGFYEKDGGYHGYDEYYETLDAFDYGEEEEVKETPLDDQEQREYIEQALSKLVEQKQEILLRVAGLNENVDDAALKEFLEADKENPVKVKSAKVFYLWNSKSSDKGQIIVEDKESALNILKKHGKKLQGKHFKVTLEYAEAEETEEPIEEKKKVEEHKIQPGELNEESKQEKQPFEVEGGFYDEDGFYILPDNKGFYDHDGYYFDELGYDEEGGYYDDFGEYIGHDEYDDDLEDYEENEEVKQDKLEDKEYRAFVESTLGHYAGKGQIKLRVGNLDPYVKASEVRQAFEKDQTYPAKISKVELNTMKGGRQTGKGVIFVKDKQSAMNILHQQGKKIKGRPVKIILESNKGDEFGEIENAYDEDLDYELEDLPKPQPKKQGVGKLQYKKKQDKDFERSAGKKAENPLTKGHENLVVKEQVVKKEDEEDDDGFVVSKVSVSKK